MHGACTVGGVGFELVEAVVVGDTVLGIDAAGLGGADTRVFGVAESEFGVCVAVNESSDALPPGNIPA